MELESVLGAKKRNSLLITPPKEKLAAQAIHIDINYTPERQKGYAYVKRHISGYTYDEYDSQHKHEQQYANSNKVSLQKSY